MKLLKIHHRILGTTNSLVSDNDAGELLVELHRTGKLLDYDVESINIESLDHLQTLIDSLENTFSNDLKPSADIKDWIARLRDVETLELLLEKR